MPDPTNPFVNHNCPKCGALPMDGVVAGGLCPRCLLAAGMEKRGIKSQIRQTGSHRFDPPPLSELAAEFPELDIIELAGRGGMGAVYKAIQKNLKRTVALKILPPEIAENADFALRFEREAQALASLNHANIVQIYHVGRTERYFYFLMEFVDGVNLREALHGQNLTPEEALSIVPQICNALQYAHDHGIVHRDIKPENILLNKDGIVKVTDFGLAKMVDWTADASLTGTQQVMGTAHYMAPEQVHATRSVDHRADIYSLGVVFYEMLTGQLPIGRFSLPSESKSLDPRLDRVVMRTLENEPDRRYQAASEVRSDIDSLGASPHESSFVNQATHSPAPPIKARNSLDRVHLPAIFLQTIGFIGLLLIGACFLFGLIAISSMAKMPAHQPTTFSLATIMFQDETIIESGRFWAPPLAASLLFAIFFLVNLPVYLILIIAGRKMRRYESYGFVVFASILAMIPINPILFPFSIFAGIWSLIVLNDSAVRAEFVRKNAFE